MPDVNDLSKLPLKQRIKLLDQQYKKSRKAWSKPSVAFRDKSERFKDPKPFAPDECSANVKLFTIAGKVGKRAPCASAAFRDKRPQRDAIKPKTDIIYDPKDPSKIGEKLKGRAVFASMTPRLAEVEELPTGQQNCGLTPRPLTAPLTKTVQSKKGSTAFASKQERLPPTKPPVCDQLYKPIIGSKTFDEVAAMLKKGPKKQAWAADKMKQRPEIKAPTDLTYNPKDPDRVFRTKVLASTPFMSCTPRLATARSELAEPMPGPGQYASPLISAGMLL